MGDTGAPKERGETNQPQDQDQNQGDTQAVPPTEEMYLPDLNNTPLSQALKNELHYRLEDEVMVECPKLKQYFRVDTFLVQRISGWIRLYTNDEVETFPISCSRTKFPPSLLDKALRGAEKQRAIPKDLPGEDWPQKLKTVLSRIELDKRLDAYADLVGRFARNLVTLEHTHMVNKGTADGYLEVAKYELQARKISNRMDEIMAVIIQDNAYREQAQFQIYPRPSTNPINQIVTSPAEADKIVAAAQKEADDIMTIALPSGTQPPIATADTATTQATYSALPTVPPPTAPQSQQ